MVYQTADPPSTPAQETLWQMNGEIMSMKRKGEGGGGDSCGGRGMSKRGLWVNLRFSGVCIRMNHRFVNTIWKEKAWGFDLY